MKRQKNWKKQFLAVSVGMAISILQVVSVFGEEAETEEPFTENAISAETESENAADEKEAPFSGVWLSIPEPFGFGICVPFNWSMPELSEEDLNEGVYGILTTPDSGSGIVFGGGDYGAYSESALEEMAEAIISQGEDSHVQYVDDILGFYIQNDTTGEIEMACYLNTETGCALSLHFSYESKYEDYIPYIIDQVRVNHTYTDSETIRRVQEALNQTGYDCGTPDGVMGENTQKAVMDYQENEEDLGVDGVISDILLERLGLSES